MQHPSDQPDCRSKARQEHVLTRLSRFGRPSVAATLQMLGAAAARDSLSGMLRRAALPTILSFGLVARSAAPCHWDPTGECGGTRWPGWTTAVQAIVFGSGAFGVVAGAFVWLILPDLSSRARRSAGCRSPGRRRGRASPPRSEVGDVGDPAAVRSLRGDVAIEQAICDADARDADRRGVPLLLEDRRQARLSHEAFDALAGDPLAVVDHPRGLIDLALDARAEPTFSFSPLILQRKKTKRQIRRRLVAEAGAEQDAGTRTPHNAPRGAERRLQSSGRGCRKRGRCRSFGASRRADSNRRPLHYE
jgi:hypothetical protein